MAPSPYQDFVRKAKERLKENQGASLVSDAYVFTSHSEYKMKQYGLSKQRVRGVIRNPKRREVGIVENTVAVMRPVSTKRVGGKETWKQEIWVLYKQSEKGKKIISAWKYPGVSPERDPIPEDILQEIFDQSEE